MRLLRFIKDLVYLNQEVSMFFRGNTPSKMRQPKSKQLASILHIADFEEDQAPLPSPQLLQPCNPDAPLP